jgi:uncharacterized damage-inducible protein DinB
MNEADITGEELLAWNEATAAKWKTAATEKPELLEVPCDIHGTAKIGQLLQHIVAAELRYAERLAKAEASDYKTLPCSTAGEIFQTHDRAMRILKSLLVEESFAWKHEIEFRTQTAGVRRAARRAVFQHALLHGIRHYAQLATLARQHGFKIEPMDYLLMVSHAAG